MDSKLLRFSGFSQLAQWQNSYKRSRQNPAVRVILLTILTALLILIILSSIRTGAVDIQTDVVLKVTLDRLTEKIGLSYESGLDYEARCVAGKPCIQRDLALILNIRWPRVIMAVLVGAGLAVSGATIQGVFRTPLAEPGLIGISSGAATGAVIAILLGVNITVLKNLPLIQADDTARLTETLLAFIAGIVTTFLVYQLSIHASRTDSLTLLLVGVAINTFAGAFIGIATYIAGQSKVGDIVFWTLGSLAEASWRDVHVFLPFIVVGLIVLPFLARQLNLMALGEAEAHHLGVDTERLRLISISIAALLVGGATAFVGMIGFVGLVVPHLIRLLFGPDHRLLLPASALGGAIFLTGMDLAARTLAVPTEIPIGVLTALIGGPFLFILIASKSP